MSFFRTILMRGVKMKKTNEFTSICELKNKFFPNDKDCEKAVEDFEELGVNLSEKSLDKIKMKIDTNN